MNIQITREELKSYKDNIPCKCENCNTIFGISKSDAYRNFKGTRITRFCSLKCKNENKIKSASVECVCLYCDKTFIKKKSAVGSNNFCSSNCAATYNNKKRKKEFKEIPEKIKSLKKYNQKPEQSYCIFCSSIIRPNGSYCSRTCHSLYDRNNKIHSWLTGELSAMSGKTLQIKGFVRDYLINLSNNQCSKCDWSAINPITRRCPLEINHIDGNPRNDKLENLEVLCPNCHALTPNFRALNKNSPRERKIREHTENIEIS